MANEAAPYSTRLMKNDNTPIQEDDRAFIFRLSEAQAKQVNRLMKNLLANSTEPNALRPDGLIFAYDGYIERRSASQFKYCENTEALAYDHNARLCQKANDLAIRGHQQAADFLNETCLEIKRLLCSDSPEKYQQISQALENVKNKPEIQADSGVQKIIVNFLLVISLVGLAYLAMTSGTRGSFWYRPQTDTENEASEFQKDIVM